MKIYDMYLPHKRSFSKKLPLLLRGSTFAKSLKQNRNRIIVVVIT